MVVSQWKERLEHVRLLARMIVLEGNVSDMFIQENGLEAGRLVELDQYLYQYLVDAGYHAVVFFNRIDSFYNPYDRTGEMLKLFYKEAEIVNDNEKPDLMQAMSAIRVAMKNEEHSIAVVINMAGQLMSSPEHLGDQEIEYLTTLFLAAKEAAEAPISSVQGWASNLLIMVTNKVHELPTWFYRYAPFVRSVEIELPDERLRKSLFQTHANYYQDWNQLEEDDREKLLLRLLQRTEGMSCMELDGILTAAEGLPIHSIEEQIYSYRHGKKENPWMEINGERVKKIAEALSSEVLGQEKAVASVRDVIIRATTGLAGIQHSSGTRPRGVLLFAGPTGVGKTEMAKVMAREIFGTEEAMLRFDMSEYSQSHSDQRLLGAPPGYVGYDEGGQLSEKVRRNPYSVVLFDEVEKAHPDVFNVLLQVLDDGHITDSTGRVVDFKNTVIIMTSNAGAENIVAPKSLGFASSSTDEQIHDDMKNKVMDEVRRMFRPEFLNRIDDIIVFHMLKKEQIGQIVDIMMKTINDRIMEQMKLSVELDDDAKAYIVDKGYDAKYGARPLRRTIQNEIEDELAERILEGKIKAGNRVLVTVKDKKLDFVLKRGHNR